MITADQRLHQADNEPHSSAGAGAGYTEETRRASLFSIFARLAPTCDRGGGRGSERRDMGHVIRAAETPGGDTS